MCAQIFKKKKKKVRGRVFLPYFLTGNVVFCWSLERMAVSVFYIQSMLQLRIYTYSLLAGA